MDVQSAIIVLFMANLKCLQFFGSDVLQLLVKHQMLANPQKKKTSEFIDNHWDDSTLFSIEDPLSNECLLFKFRLNGNLIKITYSRWIQLKLLSYSRENFNAAAYSVQLSANPF